MASAGADANRERAAGNMGLMEPCTDAEVIAASITDPSAFAGLFDRHATTMFRYFVRRVGPDEADSLLGELFRIAFERRASFDVTRVEGRPWLYGIAGNLLAKHRERETRRLDATARLLNAAATSPSERDGASIGRAAGCANSSVSRRKKRLQVGTPVPERAGSRTPAMYPRLTYADEAAALEHLNARTSTTCTAPPRPATPP
jgi:DNA-directed RNA polymerase specialized sigma24 family protein